MKHQVSGLGAGGGGGGGVTISCRGVGCMVDGFRALGFGVCREGPWVERFRGLGFELRCRVTQRGAVR